MCKLAAYIAGLALLRLVAVFWQFSVTPIRTCDIQRILDDIARPGALSSNYLLRHIKSQISGIFSYAKQQSTANRRYPGGYASLPSSAQAASNCRRHGANRAVSPDLPSVLRKPTYARKPTCANDTDTRG